MKFKITEKTKGLLPDIFWFISKDLESKGYNIWSEGDKMIFSAGVSFFGFENFINKKVSGHIEIVEIDGFTKIEMYFNVSVLKFVIAILIVIVTGEIEYASLFFIIILFFIIFISYLNEREKAKKLLNELVSNVGN